MVRVPNHRWQAVDFGVAQGGVRVCQRLEAKVRTCEDELRAKTDANDTLRRSMEQLDDTLKRTEYNLKETEQDLEAALVVSCLCNGLRNTHTLLKNTDLFLLGQKKIKKRSPSIGRTSSTIDVRAPRIQS